jgi:hypothetical protein
MLVESQRVPACIEARTTEALEQAITKVLASVTASDARGWFQHCDYRLT